MDLSKLPPETRAKLHNACEKFSGTTGAIGGPALILTFLTTIAGAFGIYGAAALTWALSVLGFGFGMVGGIAALIGSSFLSARLAKMLCKKLHDEAPLENPTG